jgi:hypothetical protein
VGAAFYSGFLNNQITNGTVAPTSTVIPGFIERDMSQLQATATNILGPTLGANSAVFVAEAGVVHVHDMPAQSELRLSAPGTYTSGDPANSAPGGAHPGFPAEPSSKFPTETSAGYRLAFALTYNNAIGPVNLIPRIQFAHDFYGITPNPAGTFLEGRMAASVGLRGTYLQSWEVDLGYTNFFGAGEQNLLNDRDFINFTVKYSF